MFSSEPRKSQIVPVLPAASREAGRVVTSNEIAPSTKKSGLVSAVRPAISGTRPAVQSGLNAAVTPVGAATVLLPRVDMPERSLDGKTIALWILGGLLAMNMTLTVLLLVRIDSPNPDDVGRAAEMAEMQEELARLKAESQKNFNHATRVFNQLQLDSDTMRGQLHVIQAKNSDLLRSPSNAPHELKTTADTSGDVPTGPALPPKRPE